MAANYLSANVQFCSSTGGIILLPLVKRVTAVKYFAGTNSSAALLSGQSSTGAQLWLENSTGTGHVTDLLSLYDPDGVTVSLGGGAMIYIYLTVSRGV